MKATQFNLDLENETGTLAKLCRVLASGGVNLLALSAPEITEPRGPVRLLVANRQLAEQADADDDIFDPMGGVRGDDVLQLHQRALAGLPALARVLAQLLAQVLDHVEDGARGAARAGHLGLKKGEGRANFWQMRWATNQPQLTSSELRLVCSRTSHAGMDFALGWGAPNWLTADRPLPPVQPRPRVRVTTQVGRSLGVS